MLLIKLKSKYSSEIIKVFAISIDKSKDQYVIELALVTDTDKLESCGFEPNFEILYLTMGEFMDHVLSIRNVG